MGIVIQYMVVIILSYNFGTTIFFNLQNDNYVGAFTGFIFLMLMLMIMIPIIIYTKNKDKKNKE